MANRIKITVAALTLEINGERFTAENISFEAVDPVTTAATLQKAKPKKKAAIAVCPGLGGSGVKCCANAGEAMGTFPAINHVGGEACACQCHQSGAASDGKTDEAKV